MQERRSVNRIKISYYVPVVNADSFEQLGTLQEISPNGMQVDTQKVLPVDKAFKLRLDLTDESFDKPFLFISARPKWVRPDPIEPTFYNIGFQIFEVADEDLVIIDKIMEKYAGTNPA